MAAPTIPPGKSWALAFAVQEANTPELRAELLTRLAKDAKAKNRAHALTVALLELLSTGGELGNEISPHISQEIELEARAFRAVDAALEEGATKLGELLERMGNIPPTGEHAPGD